MNKLSAVIIDDERGSIDSLLWELENYANDIEIIGTFQNPIEAQSKIIALNPDVLFLDIEMPAMNGFDFLSSLPNISFQVIFTTAYDQFAIQAFKISAFDYLLKPVDEEELGRVINRLKTVSDQDTTSRQLQLLLQKISKSSKTKNVAVPTQEGLEFIEVSKITRCASESNYTYLFIDGEKPLFVSKTLKDIEELLDNEQFYRIHHSHLINLNYIKKYLKGKAGSVIMKDGTQVPVSRSKKGDFLDGI